MNILTPINVFLKTTHGMVRKFLKYSLNDFKNSIYYIQKDKKIYIIFVIIMYLWKSLGKENLKQPSYMFPMFVD